MSTTEWPEGLANPYQPPPSTMEYRMSGEDIERAKIWDACAFAMLKALRESSPSYQCIHNKRKGRMVFISDGDTTAPDSGQ